MFAPQHNFTSICKKNHRFFLKRTKLESFSEKFSKIFLIFWEIFENFEFFRKHDFSIFIEIPLRIEKSGFRQISENFRKFLFFKMKISGRRDIFLWEFRKRSGQASARIRAMESIANTPKNSKNLYFPLRHLTGCGQLGSIWPRWTHYTNFIFRRSKEDLWTIWWAEKNHDRRRVNYQPENHDYWELEGEPWHFSQPHWRRKDVPRTPSAPYWAQTHFSAGRKNKLAEYAQRCPADRIQWAAL